MQYTDIVNLIETDSTTITYAGLEIYKKDNVLYCQDVATQQPYFCYFIQFHITIRTTEVRVATTKSILDELLRYFDMYRLTNGIELCKYAFWTPAFLYKKREMPAVLVAEAYGTNKQKALDYLYMVSPTFRACYDKQTGLYMGLKLYESFNAANKIRKKDNTAMYATAYAKLQQLGQKN